MMHRPLVKQLADTEFQSHFASAFGRHPVVFDNVCLAAKMPPLSYEALLGLIECNAFMEMHPNNWRKSYEVLAPSIRLAKGGKLINQSEYQRKGVDDFGVSATRFSAPRIRDLVAGGATLIFNSIDKAIPQLGAAVAETRSALGALCSLNAYYTPANSFGFGSHWDDHDVIIFQLEGSKEWGLLDNPTIEPHQSVPNIAGDPPDAELFRVIKLEQGQALYVPRGCWHFARATNDNSLHLTLGIHLPTVAEKLSSLLLSSHEHEQLRMRIISKELEAIGVSRVDFWDDLVMPSLNRLREQRSSHPSG